MKSEAGVHRLVRVSPFDPLKKRHTTFAQVLVYPELEENKDNDVSKEDILKDVRIDTYRASGAGGQSVQKTDSAVRLTHIPSGETSNGSNRVFDIFTVFWPHAVESCFHFVVAVFSIHVTLFRNDISPIRASHMP